MGDDAELCPQLPYIPAFTTEETYDTSLLSHRIQLTGEQLQQRRFAGPIRTQDSGLATDSNVKRQIGEDSGIAPIDHGMFNFDHVPQRNPSLEACTERQIDIEWAGERYRFSKGPWAGCVDLRE